MTRAMGAQPPERDASSSSAGAETEEHEPSFVRNLGIFFLFVFVVVPVIVLAVAFIFGLILAEVEGWDIVDGFYYITSMLCGLPNPLTDVEPDTTEGKIVDIVIAIWALAAGTIIGVAGGMSIIGNLIESAEKFAQRKTKKVADGDGDKPFEEPLPRGVRPRAGQPSRRARSRHRQTAKRTPGETPREVNGEEPSGQRVRA